ncbi:unnamed protein product, partial [Scytosiphon promiscuus]
SAAVQGQAEVIRALVAAGADTDLKVRRGAKEGASQDASPLLLAVVGGHLEAARVLLEGGAEVGAKNSKGLTPLHVSCLKPNAGMVSLLLLWGADTNARDKKKRTPEQIVGRRGKDPVEEEAVRTVLKQATAAKLLALANSAKIDPRTNALQGLGGRDESEGVTLTANASASAGLAASSAASCSGAASAAGVDSVDTAVAADSGYLGSTTGAAASASSSLRTSPPPLPPPSAGPVFSQRGGHEANPIAPSPPLLPPPPPPPQTPSSEQPTLSHPNTSLTPAYGTEGTAATCPASSGPPELLLEGHPLPPPLSPKHTDLAADTGAAASGGSISASNSDPSAMTKHPGESDEHCFEVGIAAAPVEQQAVAGVFVAAEVAVGEG